MKKLLVILMLGLVIGLPSIFAQESDEAAEPAAEAVEVTEEGAEAETAEEGESSEESEAVEGESSEEGEAAEEGEVAEGEAEEEGAAEGEVAEEPEEGEPAEEAVEAEPAVTPPKVAEPAPAAPATPDRWGVGLAYRSVAGFALSVKAPMKLPLYFGLYFDGMLDLIDLRLRSNDKPIQGDLVAPMRFGLSVDWYFVDTSKDKNFGFIVGAGLYFDYTMWSWHDPAGEAGVVDGLEVYDKLVQGDIGIGARVLGGISWKPSDLIQVYVNYVPNIGVGIRVGKKEEKGEGTGFNAFQWNVTTAEIGARLWF
jgi:hypothetical protein